LKSTSHEKAVFRKPESYNHFLQVKEGQNRGGGKVITPTLFSAAKGRKGGKKGVEFFRECTSLRVRSKGLSSTTKRGNPETKKAHSVQTFLDWLAAERKILGAKTLGAQERDTPPLPAAPRGEKSHGGGDGPLEYYSFLLSSSAGGREDLVGRDSFVGKGKRTLP